MTISATEACGCRMGETAVGSEDSKWMGECNRDTKLCRPQADDNTKRIESLWRQQSGATVKNGELLVIT